MPACMHALGFIITLGVVLLSYHVFPRVATTWTSLFIAPVDPYNAVIGITTLAEIEEGWEVSVSSDSDLFRTMHDWKKVGVTGFYNSGKSYILSLMTGKNLGHSRGESGRTIGVSLMLDDDATIYYDVAGYQRATPDGSVAPLHVTDSFISSWIKTEVDCLLVVVSNELRRGEQLLIRETIHNAPAALELMIIHNYRDYSDIREVEDNIKIDIEQAYSATPQWERTQQGLATFWQQRYVAHNAGPVKSIRHYVLAQEGSNAGKRYNAKTVALLKRHLPVKRMHIYEDINMLLSDITTSMNRVLPQYFYDRPLLTLKDALIGTLTEATSFIGMSSDEPVPPTRDERQLWSRMVSFLWQQKRAATDKQHPDVRCEVKIAYHTTEGSASSESCAVGGDDVCPGVSRIVRFEKTGQSWPRGCKLVYLPLDPITLEDSVRVKVAADIFISKNGTAHMFIEVPGVRPGDLSIRLVDKTRFAIHGMKRPSEEYDFTGDLDIVNSAVDTKGLHHLGLRSRGRRYGDFLYHADIPIEWNIGAWGELQTRSYTVKEITQNKALPFHSFIAFENGVLRISLK